MPEGDSLHRAAHQLGPLLTGKPLRTLSLPRRSESTEGLAGKLIEGVEARGKNLLVHFEGGLSLHVHLKMWGRILTGRREEARAPFGQGVVVVLETEQHRVVVRDAPVARLVYKRDLVRDLHFRALGPDLLGDAFDADEALRRLRLRKQSALGEVLMDQSTVAGIGNVWKSELCFNLKLDPFAPVAAYSDDELRELLALAQTQMRQNVDRKPRRIPDPFTPPHYARATRLNRRQGERHVSVYGREGKPCYDCGTTIQMKRQGGMDRSTYYCPRCQPARSVA